MEIEELAERLKESEKNNGDLKSSLEVALANINSLELKTVENEKNLRLFSATISKLSNKSSNAPKALNKETSCKQSEAEARCRLLSQRLSELEALQNTPGVELKLKEVEDKLHAKTKDLKTSEANLRKTEKSVKNLNNKLTSCNKKISELENSNTRLQLIANQGMSSVNARLEQKDDKSSQADVSKKDSPRRNSPHKGARNNTSTQRKFTSNVTNRCKDDNKGKCKDGNNCRNVHARRTCQMHSKFGSCSFESQCEHRHPDTICFEWQDYGSCRHGDECRHKHPQNVVASSENFLGRRKTSPQQ